MFEFIEKIDRELLLFLNKSHNVFFDDFFWIASKTYASIPVFLLLLYLIYKNYRLKQFMLITLAAILCVSLTDLISVHLFKEVFERFRPTHNLEIGHLVKTYQFENGEKYFGGLYGFVSSHAANIAGLTTLFILLFRAKYKSIYLLIVWLILISFSRIYLGVHYPLDIVGGWIIGFLIGALSYTIIQKLILNTKQDVTLKP